MIVKIGENGIAVYGHFESRLFWRDHFIQRLESFPEMEEKSLNSAYADLKYEDDPDKLQAWIKGETGYPMVDACMRCLAHTGFLNFRMRAMVVSLPVMVYISPGKPFISHWPKCFTIMNLAFICHNCRCRRSRWI